MPVADLAVSHTRLNSQHSVSLSLSDSAQQSNLILFGLEEKPMLSDTKTSVDEVLEFLVGHPVGVSDLVRLGRRIPISQFNALILFL